MKRGGTQGGRQTWAVGRAVCLPELLWRPSCAPRSSWAPRSFEDAHSQPHTQIHRVSVHSGTNGLHFCQVCGAILMRGLRRNQDPTWKLPEARGRCSQCPAHIAVPGGVAMLLGGHCERHLCLRALSSCPEGCSQPTTQHFPHLQGPGSEIPSHPARTCALTHLYRMCPRPTAHPRLPAWK